MKYINNLQWVLRRRILNGSISGDEWVRKIFIVSYDIEEKYLDLFEELEKIVL